MLLKLFQKKHFFLSLVNIFFSVNGIKKIPSKIKKGNFTDSQIGIYVGGKSFAYMQVPRVFVQTSL